MKPPACWCKAADKFSIDTVWFQPGCDPELHLFVWERTSHPKKWQGVMIIIDPQNVRWWEHLLLCGAFLFPWHTKTDTTFNDNLFDRPVCKPMTQLSQTMRQRAQKVSEVRRRTQNQWNEREQGLAQDGIGGCGNIHCNILCLHSQGPCYVASPSRIHTMCMWTEPWIYLAWYKRHHPSGGQRVSKLKRAFLQMYFVIILVWWFPLWPIIDVNCLSKYSNNASHWHHNTENIDPCHHVMGLAMEWRGQEGRWCIDACWAFG